MLLFSANSFLLSLNSHTWSPLSAQWSTFSRQERWSSISGCVHASRRIRTVLCTSKDTDEPVKADVLDFSTRRRQSSRPLSLHKNSLVIHAAVVRDGIDDSAVRSPSAIPPERPERSDYGASKLCCFRYLPYSFLPLDKLARRNGPGRPEAEGETLSESRTTRASSRATTSSSSPFSPSTPCTRLFRAL